LEDVEQLVELTEEGIARREQFESNDVDSRFEHTGPRKLDTDTAAFTMAMDNYEVWTSFAGNICQNLHFLQNGLNEFAVLLLSAIVLIINYLDKEDLIWMHNFCITT